MALVKRLEGYAITDEATQSSAPSMASVIRQFGASYLSRFGSSMPQAHRKAMWAIAGCRTAAMGGHVVECDGCRVQDYAYHSCRHRSCPKCLKEEGEEWFEARRRELLPVPHFHVVFTVPQDLHRIIRRHQRDLYPVLMRAAAATLVQVAAAPEHLGGTVGVMAALHTWSSTLIYHLHVHCLVPAGAVDAQGQWRAAKGPWLAPTSLLAKVFRAKLRAMMNAAVKDLDFPSAVFDTEWQVHVEQPEHGAETLLRYLGRSLHRGPLPDHHIVAITEKDVVFRYRASDWSKWRTMTLSGHEFLRRFLQHVWPDRVHKVRYFGLWSRKSRVQFEALRQQLLAAMPAAPTPAMDPPPLAPSDPDRPRWLQCPHCNGQRIIISQFGPRETPPPLRPPPSALPPTARPP